MENHEKSWTVGTGDSNPLVGHAAGAEERARIRKHMEVISSCGSHVGEVDGVEDGRIKLTKDDLQASGHHHFIPLDWVAKVDNKIYLNKDAAETRSEWEEEPVGHNPL